jgi:hypothetical protein
MSQMIIANRLHDGLIVFLAADGVWVESIQEGWLIEGDPDRSGALRIGELAQRSNQVVGPDLIEVTERNGTRMPVSVREAIRASGPTVQTGAHGAVHVPVR